MKLGSADAVVALPVVQHRQIEAGFGKAGCNVKRVPKQLIGLSKAPNLAGDTGENTEGSDILSVLGKLNPNQALSLGDPTCRQGTGRFGEVRPQRSDAPKLAVGLVGAAIFPGGAKRDSGQPQNAEDGRDPVDLHR